MIEVIGPTFSGYAPSHTTQPSGNPAGLPATMWVARPTGFEPVTFGFVDRGRCSVGFVWAQGRA